MAQPQMESSEPDGSPSERLIRRLIDTFGESVMAPTGSQYEKTLAEHGYRKLTLTHERGSVNLIFHHTNEAAVELFFLAAEPHQSGLGTKFMQLLTEFADEAGATLWLEAEPIRYGPGTPIPAKALRRFYESFWFDEADIPESWLNSYRREHKPPISHPMIRRPRHPS